MTQDTWEQLQAVFSEFPILVAGPATDKGIDAVSERLGRPLPTDFREFLRRFGGATVGPYPVFGLRVAEAMGNGDTLLEQNNRFHSQGWPGVEDWLIISRDHAGNPFGIAPNGQVWVSDHDFRIIEPVASNFEGFLRRVCLKLPGTEPPRTFRELLDRYGRGERDFVGSELDEDPQNDLSGVCLDGADLSRAFIIASLRATSLRDVRFIGANVKTCDFRDADLRGADFTGAALCATEFTGAKLDGAKFAGSSIHSYTLKEGEKPDW